MKPGKMAEAVAFMKEWAEGMASTNARVLRPEAGEMSKIPIMQEFDSMAAREAFFAEYSKTRSEAPSKGFESLTDLHHYYKTIDSW
jgi:hypothetical protein